MKAEYLQRIKEDVLDESPADPWLIDYKGYCIELVEYVDELHAKVREAFISGYESGHNDTVESCYGCPEGKADDYGWGGRR